MKTYFMVSETFILEPIDCEKENDILWRMANKILLKLCKQFLTSKNKDFLKTFAVQNYQANAKYRRRERKKLKQCIHSLAKEII